MSSSRENSCRRAISSEKNGVIAGRVLSRLENKRMSRNATTMTMITRFSQGPACLGSGLQLTEKNRSMLGGTNLRGLLVLWRWPLITPGLSFLGGDDTGLRRELVMRTPSFITNGSCHQHFFKQGNRQFRNLCRVTRSHKGNIAQGQNKTCDQQG